MGARSGAQLAAAAEDADQRSRVRGVQAAEGGFGGSDGGGDGDDDGDGGDGGDGGDDADGRRVSMWRCSRCVTAPFPTHVGGGPTGLELAEAPVG